MTCVMVIAGSDSSGGAGLTRDVATASELGVLVKPVLTAVTTQTDETFCDSLLVPPGIIRAQITAAMTGAPPAAIKIGMLGTASAAKTVIEGLNTYNIPVILDPVLKSSSGGSLFADGDICDLFPLTTLVTPNLDEAAALTNRPKATDEDEIIRQAALLMDRGTRGVLIKGGHGNGIDCTDHLFGPTGHSRLVARRLAQQRRGTGCALSTAIACYIATGQTPEEACQMAKHYMQGWFGQIIDPDLKLPE